MTDEVTDDGERIVQHYEGFTHGAAVVIIDEDPSLEQWGLGLGEEGTIKIIEVGSKEHGNVRTAIYFVPEGADESVCEVRPDLIEEL